MKATQLVWKMKSSKLFPSRPQEFKNCSYWSTEKGQEIFLGFSS